MRKYLICFLALIAMPLMVLAETTVTFSPSTISLGESAELVIETDRPLAQEPDFSGLMGNFAVAGTQQGVKTVSINGRRRSRYRLSLTVFPRKEGELSTGDLLINGVQIKAAVLTVEPAGSSSRLPITFTASASQSTVYPDEAFLFKIKLSHGVALLDAKIIPLAIENARVTALDNDRTYQEMQDGRPIHVFERTFVVTPEKSGYLTIPAVEVYALVANNDQTGMPDLFGEGILFNGLIGSQKEVRLETNPVQVTVLEKPADWTGWWLPATEVTLTAEDKFPDKISVGDSLTRVIKLSAMGVEAEQLPTVTQSGTEKIKVYPSPEQRETIPTPVGDIQGKTLTSFILVPTAAGEVTLPEVKVPWFNTRTRQVETAVLPAKTITVIGGTTQTVQEKTAQPQTVKKPKKESPRTKANRRQKKSEPKSPIAQPVAAKSGINLYWIIGCSIMALIIGLGLGFLLFRRRRHRSYRIQDDSQKGHKKKKPLPDLYPF